MGMLKKHSETTMLALREYVITIVEIITGVSASETNRASRGSPNAAFARMMAMYLLHVEFSLSYKEVAKLFTRDPSTIAYACRIIEDSRDASETDERLENIRRLIDASKELVSRGVFS